MALDLLLEEAQGMSEASLMEVVRFMRFVKSENKKNSAESASPDVEGSSHVIRKPGLYKGQIKMADDFERLKKGLLIKNDSDKIETGDVEISDAELNELIDFDERIKKLKDKNDTATGET